MSDEIEHLLMKAKNSALKALSDADLEALREECKLKVSPEEIQILKDAEHFFSERNKGLMSVSSSFFATDRNSQHYSLNTININFNPHALKGSPEDMEKYAENILLHEEGHGLKDVRSEIQNYTGRRILKQIVTGLLSTRNKGGIVAAGVAWPHLFEGIVNHISYKMGGPVIDMPYALTALATIGIVRLCTMGIRSEEKHADRLATVLSSISSEEATKIGMENKKDQNLYEKANAFFHNSRNPVVMVANNLAAFACNFTHPLPWLRQQQNKEDLLLKEKYFNKITPQNDHKLTA